MENRTKRNTVLFIAVLLLAGAANVLSRGGMPAFEALMASINYLAYTGLLFRGVPICYAHTAHCHPCEFPGQ